MIFFGEIIRAPSSLDLSTTCPIWLFELDCIEFIVYFRVRVWVHVVDGSRITTVTTRYHIHDWTASQNNSQRIELNVLKLENWSLFCSTPVTRTFDSFMVYYFPLKFNFFPRVICRHSSTPIYIQIIFRQPQHAHIHRSPNVWREYWGNRLINRHTLELTMATFRTSWQTHTTNQLNGIATVGAIFERNRTVKQQYLITSLAGWIKLWSDKEREREKKQLLIFAKCLEGVSGWRLLGDSDWEHSTYTHQTMWCSCHFCAPFIISPRCLFFSSAIVWNSIRHMLLLRRKISRNQRACVCLPVCEWMENKTVDLWQHDTHLYFTQSSTDSNGKGLAAGYLFFERESVCVMWIWCFIWMNFSTRERIIIIIA